MKYPIIYLSLLTLLVSNCSNCSRTGRMRQRLNDGTPTTSTNAPKPAETTPLPPAMGSYTPPPTVENSPSKGDKSLPELVKQIEPAAFLVFAINQNGDVIGQGSGFFLEATGVGVSNFHVMKETKRWAIKTSDGEQYEVERLIKTSAAFDYAIFQIKAGGRTFKTLKLATQTPAKGEEVIILGNPEGMESTLTRGIVSSIRGQDNIADAILQTDAAISHGSSGSPVMNLRGEVVGIATYKVEKCENCNFAYNSHLIGK
jgi:serine protease Do